MRRWYISFHGGNGPHAWNNIHVFDLDGAPLGKALDTHTLPGGLALRELRGFAFGPDGDLYVANAYKDASQILRFAGTLGPDGRHPFHAIYSERHAANPGLDHPFDVVFGPDRNLYVASQDTSLVGRYFGPDASDGRPGDPMPHPPGLPASSSRHLLPGTFVPSAAHLPTGVKGIRRAIFGLEGDLYVADRDADRIKRYDGRSGAFKWEYRHQPLTAPVHLLVRVPDGVLLVGSRDRDAIFAIETETGAVATLVEPKAGGLKAPAGMALGPDGLLYVCSRETRQVLRFDPFTGSPSASPFIDDLNDAPEFIMLVDH